MYQGYSNVYDAMFTFFRNGNSQISKIMKLEIDDNIVSPFVTKLTSLRTMLEDITFALQLAFFVSLVIAIIVSIACIINLLIDFKT